MNSIRTSIYGARKKKSGGGLFGPAATFLFRNLSGILRIIKTPTKQKVLPGLVGPARRPKVGILKGRRKELEAQVKQVKQVRN
jgi:hypothetical protein